MNLEIYKVDELRTREGLLVIWSLGNFCPYKCTYCNSYYNDGTDPYHPIENIRNIMSKIPRGSRIIFSGGEPTYHPEFETILDEKPAGITFGAISNGARPYSFWERAIEKLNTLILTFHSEFATLDRFIQTAELCRPKLQRINLTMIPWMWEESVNVYETFKAAGLPVAPKPLVKDFGFKSSSLIDEYLPEQIKWIEQKNTETIELKYIGLWDKSGNLIQKTNPSEMLSAGNTNFKGWQCHTPSKTLYINTNGDIFDTSCKQRRLLGTVYTGFELKTDPVTCLQNFCWCHSDISPLKVRS